MIGQATSPGGAADPRQRSVPSGVGSIGWRVGGWFGPPRPHRRFQRTGLRLLAMEETVWKPAAPRCDGARGGLEVAGSRSRRVGGYDYLLHWNKSSPGDQVPGPRGAAAGAATGHYRRQSERPPASTGASKGATSGGKPASGTQRAPAERALRASNVRCPIDTDRARKAPPAGAAIRGLELARSAQIQTKHPGTGDERGAARSPAWSDAAPWKGAASYRFRASTIIVFHRNGKRPAPWN